MVCAVTSRFRAALLAALPIAFLCASRSARAEPRHGVRLAPSLSVAQDFLWAGGTDVCTEKSQLELGWSCFRQQGSQYHGTPVEGFKDTVSPGFTPATTRLLLGLDVVPIDPLALGFRLGYAFGGSPRTDGGHRFHSLHLEGRVSYWLGQAYPRHGIAPFAFAGGGVAEVDAHYPVDVKEDRSVPPPPEQLDNPDRQTLDVYKKLGTGFGSVGLGGYYGFGPAGGILLAAKGMFLFPSSGFVAELELGYAVGLDL